MRVQRKSKKPIIIASAIIVALISAGLIWYYASSTKSNTENSQGQSTSSQGDSRSNDDTRGSQEDSAQLQSDRDSGQSVEHEKEKDLPQLYEGDNTNRSNSLTGVITTKSVASGSLTIRNTINQLVDTGSCKLTLTSGSRTVTRSVEIIQNPSSSTCAGFDVPVAELGQGQWSIQIDITSGDKQATLKDTVNI